MTTEEKAKAYDEALERFKAFKKKYYTKNTVIGDAIFDKTGEMQRDFESIFSELHESEDERMVREFNDWLCEEIECRTNDLRDEKDRRTLNMLCYVLTKVKDWFEKQKESLHISEMCKENADSFTDEDERIRKGLIEALKTSKTVGELKFILPESTREECIAYLEKQKELPFVKDVILGYPGLYFYDGERMHFRGPAMEEKQKEETLRYFIDNFPYSDEQKEQKPTDDKAFEEWLNDWYQGSKEAGGDVVMSEAEFKNWSRGIRNMYANQESAEWSKMDKENIDSLVIILHKALSKGISCEAEVLDLMDWLKSLRPSWKPSEQEKGALRTAICILTEVRKFPKAAEQLQNILDAFEGKKSRKDRKPSQEQKPAWNEKDKKKFERLAFLI